MILELGQGWCYDVASQKLETVPVLAILIEEGYHLWKHI